MGTMERAPGDLGLDFGKTANDPVQQLKELKNGAFVLRFLRSSCLLLLLVTSRQAAPP